MRVVSGTARGTTLRAPNGVTTRPTADRVKEALFSIIQFDIPGASVLDLFGGSGQLGIEALSRGANRAVFVDFDKNACSVIRENLKRTNFLDDAVVCNVDSFAYLRMCKGKFNIILLDPPYAKDYLENALKLITEIDILQSGGIIVSERSLEKN